MIHLVSETVHTTGVNWDSVAAIVGTFSGVLGMVAIISGWIAKTFAKYLTSQIADAIHLFRTEVVSTLENRLQRVEDMTEDLRNTRGRDRRNDQEIGDKET